MLVFDEFLVCEWAPKIDPPHSSVTLGVRGNYRHEKGSLLDANAGSSGVPIYSLTADVQRQAGPSSIGQGCFWPFCDVASVAY